MMASCSLNQVLNHLECAVCLEVFDEPCELSCSHVFCRTPCLENLVDDDSQFLICPLCRAAHKLPSGGVKDLPVNNVIRRIVKSAQDESKQPGPESCQVCGVPGSTCRCRHCIKYICTECHQRHTRNMKEDLEQLATYIEGEASKTLDKLIISEDSFKSMHDSVIISKQTISDSFDKLENAIRTRRDLLLDELDNFYVKEAMKLSKVTENQHTILKMISSCHQVKHIVQDEATQIMISKLDKDLREQLAHMMHTMEVIPVGQETLIDVNYQHVFDIIEATGSVNYLEKSLPKSKDKAENGDCHEEQRTTKCLSPAQQELQKTKCSSAPQQGNSSETTHEWQINAEDSQSDYSETEDASDNNGHETQSEYSETEDASEGNCNESQSEHSESEDTSEYIADIWVDSEDEQALWEQPENKSTLVKTINDRFECIDSVAMSHVTGHIAVSDSRRHIITVFDKNGNFIRELGGHGNGFNEYNSPAGLSFDSDGRLLVTDHLNSRIQVYNKFYNFIRKISSFGGASFQLDQPRDVAAFKNVILVADSGNDRITRFSNLGGGTQKCDISKRLFNIPRRIVTVPSTDWVGVADCNRFYMFQASAEDNKIFKDITADVPLFKHISKNTVFTFNTLRNLILTNDGESVEVHDLDDQLCTFISEHARRCKDPVKSIAAYDDIIVVAGAKFVEIYKFHYD